MQTEIKDTYYQTIHELPLNKFIDCIVDNNLSALTISGFPAPEQLAIAWDYILSQYSELIGTQEYKMYKILYCEVENLKITLNQIAIILGGNVITESGTEKVKGFLNIGYHEYFATEVNDLLKTNYKFNWDDQKSYQEDIKKGLSRSKALKIKLDLKNLQFKAIEKKNNAKPGVKMDRAYFTSILITLSNFAKFRIDSSVTMDEYCLRIKEHNDYCQQLTKKPDG